MCALVWCPQCKDKALSREIAFPVAGEDAVIRVVLCDRCGYELSRLMLVTPEELISVKTERTFGECHAESNADLEWLP